MKGFTHPVVLAMLAAYAQGFIYKKQPGKQSELCQKYFDFTQRIAKGLSIRENAKVVYPPKSRRYLAYSCDSIYEAFLNLGENSTIFNVKKKKLTVAYRTCSNMAKLESGVLREVDANLKNTQWPHYMPLSLGCVFKKSPKDGCKKSVCVLKKTKEFAFPGKLDDSVYSAPSKNEI